MVRKLSLYSTYHTGWITGNDCICRHLKINDRRAPTMAPWPMRAPTPEPGKTFLEFKPAVLADPALDGKD